MFHQQQGLEKKGEKKPKEEMEKGKRCIKRGGLICVGGVFISAVCFSLRMMDDSWRNYIRLFDILNRPFNHRWEGESRR